MCFYVHAVCIFEERKQVKPIVIFGSIQATPNDVFVAPSHLYYFPQNFNSYLLVNCLTLLFRSESSASSFVKYNI